MEYIFWGHNIPLAAHLRETLQCKIIECITFQQIKSCLSSIEYIDFCVFYGEVRYGNRYTNYCPTA